MMRINVTLSGFSAILALLASIATSSGTVWAESSGHLTMAELTQWLDAYGEAWESRDPERAAGLFTKDASYQVTPYEEAHEGQDGVRRYWADVTANQRNVDFDYQPLSISGDTGIAHWSARFDVEPGGTQIELDGIFVLEFDDNGQCRSLREWWHLRSQANEDQAQTAN